jgi:hypothetical protein
LAGYELYGEKHEYEAKEGFDADGNPCLVPLTDSLDVEALQQEIEDEALTDAELGALLRTFDERHSYTEQRLMACGACGHRQFERTHPNFKYVDRPLTSSLLDPLNQTIHIAPSLPTVQIKSHRNQKQEQADSHA